MVFTNTIFFQEIIDFPTMTSQRNEKPHRSSILEELDILRQQDYSFTSGRILGSMCTQPHPIAKHAYLRFLETNLGDPELFPGTKTIENHYISFLKTLLHAPNTAAGQIVSGGTEGNITAMWIAKELSKKKEIIIPQSAHFSFTKIASLMSMKLVSVPLTPAYTIKVSELRKKITSDTAAVVAIAGSTDLGTVDPIQDISDVCQDEHLFLHVDAAFGGFILPFTSQLGLSLPDFDFSVPGVSSVSIDAHKMGCSAIPLGTVLVRNRKWLDSICVESPCISSKTQTGLLGTRSGGPVAAAYAVATYLGNDGYTKIVQRCLDTTHYAERQIQKMGLPLAIKPVLNVLAIRLRHPQDVIQKLAKQGWRVSPLDHLSAIRIVVMPHVTQDVIEDFLPVLKKICKEVGEL